MPAPKKNEYWKFRTFQGRKKEYTPEEWYQKIVDYCEFMKTQVWNKKEAIKSGEHAGTLIDIPTQTPMSIGSFCLFAGVSQQTFTNYEKEKGYEEYFGITAWAREIIETHQLEGAVVGAYNPNIIARKLGLVDKADITSGDKPIESNVVIFKIPDNGRDKRE